MPQRDESGGFSSAPDGMPPLPSEPAPMMPPEVGHGGPPGFFDATKLGSSWWVHGFF
jgi:hypothetical protein